MGETKLTILHYAGIGFNKASGVSVIVPQILSAQADYARVGFYNYSGDCFPISKKVEILTKNESDDYHTFPKPFQKPDIVVFHSPFGIPRIVSIAKMLQQEKIPYVIVPHGCFSSASFKKKRFKKFLACNLYFNSCFKKASAVQFLSEGERNTSKYNKKPIILTNGIRIPEKTERKKNSDQIVISYIGRKDIYHKGIDLLIEACGMVKDALQEKNVVLNLYGPADGEDMVDQLIQQNQVTGFVKNHPGIFDKEKIEVLQNSSFLALTSRFEGQPVMILEAWANSCPTLVTPGTNVWEETKENHCGWCPKGDSESIAKMLLHIIEHPKEIDVCSEKAFAYVKQTYEWSVVAQKAISEYERIVRKNDTNY